MRAYFIFMIAILISVVACDPKVSMEERVIKYTGSNSVTDITSNKNSCITVTGVEGKDIYIVKANASNNTVNEASSMEILINAQGGDVVMCNSQVDETSSQFTVLPHLPSMYFDPSKIDLTQESTLSRSVSVDPVEYNVGDSKSFWINDNLDVISEGWEQTEATVRAKGKHCYVWADVAHWSGSNASGEKINQAVADKIADKFDYIYPIVTNLFGYEKGGGSGGDGGIDRDERISILMYDIADDYKAGRISGIVGYFWGKDEFVDGVIPETRSNESEIFYIDSGFANKSIELVYSTLAHEFQHMINFNQKGETAEVPAWYNEMLSMLCEDVMATHLGTSIENSPAGSRPREFNEYYTGSGITEWNGAYSYGTAFTFGAFLTRNYGGIKLIANMSRNKSVGIESINDALASCGISTTFDNVFLEFSQALVRPINSASPGFEKDTTKTTYGEYSYSQAGFDLWDSTLGGGPESYDIYSNYGELRPYGNKVYSEYEWLDVDSDSIKFMTGEKNSSSVKVYLVIR